MEFLGYFGGVFEPVAFALLLGGTVGGLILGATPGLSPTMAVALLIPFTFHLTPTQGLILLGAAYTSTVAGGAVSAILLKIPGAPANIATALDGNAMAKKGQGARALHLSFLASGVGGIIGIFLLIFLTPLLARWALQFGPSHLFWIAILGVTVIGSLDSKSFVKGLLSGCIGLWLSTIGYDDIQGAERFVFVDALSGGITIIPALIGLFAIPQVLDMLSKGRHSKAVESIKVPRYRFVNSLKEVLSSVRSLSIGTTVGTIVGLIPGVGGQIAGLVAYDQARNLSPQKNKFGSGHAEGVIAAESANNAMVGPSLVPLLTLSIPRLSNCCCSSRRIAYSRHFPRIGYFRHAPASDLDIRQFYAARTNCNGYFWHLYGRLGRPYRQGAQCRTGRGSPRFSVVWIVFRQPEYGRRSDHAGIGAGYVCSGKIRFFGCPSRVGPHSGTDRRRLFHQWVNDRRGTGRPVGLLLYRPT